MLRYPSVSSPVLPPLWNVPLLHTHNLPDTTSPTQRPPTIKDLVNFRCLPIEELNQWRSWAPVSILYDPLPVVT